MIHFIFDPFPYCIAWKHFPNWSISLFLLVNANFAPPLTLKACFVADGSLPKVIFYLREVTLKKNTLTEGSHLEQNDIEMTVGFFFTSQVPLLSIP